LKTYFINGKILGVTVDVIAQELDRRLTAWRELLERGGPTDVERQVIRELGMYGGAQGVWVDAARTRALTVDDTGIAVGLLHTGRHYADDLSETGILYHYPRTGRAGRRDVAEVEATKRAAELALPVFVITPSQASTNRRDVHLGWVVEWDDEDEIFLVTFTDEAVPESQVVPASEFRLFADDVETRRVEAVARPNQQRFKFDVLARYGARCAVCDIDVPQVLDAIHLAEKAAKGSDHPENGLVLCATHHRAFDRGLFAIDPVTRVIQMQSGVGDLGITRTSIAHLKAYPHTEALKWRWKRRSRIIDPGMTDNP
jgi:putative restriction endonuclease